MSGHIYLRFVANDDSGRGESKQRVFHSANREARRLHNQGIGSPLVGVRRVHVGLDIIEEGIQIGQLIVVSLDVYTL